MEKNESKLRDTHNSEPLNEYILSVSQDSNIHFEENSLLAEQKERNSDILGNA